MIDEIKKSISSILYERTTSPLSGTFLLSWIIWNWKIVVVLFFTTSKELKTTKFEYIDSNLLNWCDSLFYPIISTVLILTLFSWTSVKAYQLWLYFDNEKKGYKTKVENKKLLTREQSMKLRLELEKERDYFNDLINTKEKLIEALKNEQNGLAKIEENNETKTDSKKNAEEEMKEFFNNLEAVDYFGIIANYLTKDWEVSDEEVPDNIVSFYIAYELIENTVNQGRYKLTAKGKTFLKEYFKRGFE